VVRLVASPSARRRRRAVHRQEDQADQPSDESTATAADVETDDFSDYRDASGLKFAYKAHHQRLRPSRPIWRSIGVELDPRIGPRCSTSRRRDGAGSGHRRADRGARRGRGGARPRPAHLAHGEVPSGAIEARAAVDRLLTFGDRGLLIFEKFGQSRRSSCCVPPARAPRDLASTKRRHGLQTPPAPPVR